MYQWARLLISIIHYCAFEHGPFNPLLHSYIHQMNIVLCRSLRSFLSHISWCDTLFGECCKNVDESKKTSWQTKPGTVHNTKHLLWILKCMRESVCICLSAKLQFVKTSKIFGGCCFSWLQAIISWGSNRQRFQGSGRISYGRDKYQAISLAEK